MRAAKVLVVDDRAPQTGEETARIRSWFGFYEMAVPELGKHLRPVQIVTVRIATQPKLGPDDPPLGRRRAGIWHNGLRNRLIAQLAECLAGVRSARTQFRQFASSLGADAARQRVVLLVESAEHAAALAEWLSERSILASEDAQFARLPPRWRTKLSERLRGPQSSRTLIATFAAAREVDWQSTDIVLRADGGTDLPPIADANLVTSQPNPTPLTLIDIHDCAYPAGRERFRQRQEAYAQRGWFLRGADPTFERFREFMWSLLEQEARS